MKYSLFAILVFVIACSSSEPPAETHDAGVNNLNNENNANNENNTNNANNANSQNNSNNINNTNNLADVGFDTDPKNNISNNTNLTRPQMYARANPFTKLLFEVDAAPEKEPREEARMHLLGEFEKVIDKPGGIVFMRDETLTAKGEDHVWTFDEIRELEKSTRNFPLEADETSIHILYLDGAYEKDEEEGVVLGIAWGNHSIAMFKDNIDRVCSGLLERELCSLTEASVLLHEAGHVLGLVNIGAPMQVAHQDEEHDTHDVSNECVMYWAYTNGGIVDVLSERIVAGGAEALTFDQNCINDLAALKN